MREEGWRSEHEELWQRHWHDGWKVGRWRELGELAKLVPGLRGAIIHHVALHGQLGPNGSRIIFTPE